MSARHLIGDRPDLLLGSFDQSAHRARGVEQEDHVDGRGLRSLDVLRGARVSLRGPCKTGTLRTPESLNH